MMACGRIAGVGATCWRIDGVRDTNVWNWNGWVVTPQPAARRRPAT